MSYEGRIEFLCETGHRWTQDAYDEGRECPNCKGAVVWSNDIDDTNGDCFGEIPDDVWANYELTPDQYDYCNLGHRHLVSEVTYRVPTPEEQVQMRTHWCEALNRRVSTAQDINRRKRGV